MHKAIDVAQHFLNLAKKKPSSLTPMELIKLTYIAHGWMLGLYSRALIRDEVEAWKYGPVIPRIYHKVKNFGSKPITKDVSRSPADLDTWERSVVDQVFAKYGDLGGVKLSTLTHEEGSPWDQTWDGTYARTISDDLIEQYYKELAV